MKQRETSVFSSITPGEFYSTPDVEGETTVLSFTLDYTPVIPGTLHTTLVVAGRQYELHDDGQGTLFAEPRRGFWRWLWQGLIREISSAVKFGVIDYETGTVQLSVAMFADYQYDTGEEKGTLADLSKEIPERFRADFRKMIRGNERPSKEFMELLDTDEDVMEVVERATDIMCASFGFPRENKLKKKEGT